MLTQKYDSLPLHFCFTPFHTCYQISFNFSLHIPFYTFLSYTCPSTSPSPYHVFDFLSTSFKLMFFLYYSNLLFLFYLNCAPCLYILYLFILLLCVCYLYCLIFLYMNNIICPHITSSTYGSLFIYYFLHLLSTPKNFHVSFLFLQFTYTC